MFDVWVPLKAFNHFKYKTISKWYPNSSISTDNGTKKSTPSTNIAIQYYYFFRCWFGWLADFEWLRWIYMMVFCCPFISALDPRVPIRTITSLYGKSIEMRTPMIYFHFSVAKIWVCFIVSSFFIRMRVFHSFCLNNDDDDISELRHFWQYDPLHFQHKKIALICHIMQWWQSEKWLS